MNMRVLLVITLLLLQSVASIGVTRTVEAPASGGSCACGTSCCCGVCTCQAGPDLPQRRPDAPPPRDGKEVAPFLALDQTGLEVRLVDPARHALRPKAEPAPTRSHNETQALLCVWRT